MSEFVGQTDLSLTFDGDLELEGGDLRLVSGDEWLAQTVNIIMRTTAGDYKVYPNIDGSLEDYIGEPNTRDTAKSIEQKVRYQLGRDNWAYPGTLNCRVVPTDRDEASVFVFFDLPPGKRTYLNMLQFNYNSGGVVTHDLAMRTDIEAQPAPIGSRKVPENQYLRRIAEQRANSK